MKGSNQLLTFFLLSVSINTAWSQSSQVGIIDFYGARSIKTDVRKCLPFRENDTIKFLLNYPDTTGYAKTKRTIVQCLLANPEIKQANIEFVCCDGVESKWMVYIGVSNEPKLIYSNAKTADIKLPPEITKTYDSLENLLAGAIASGEAGDDHSEGHALFVHLPARKLQQKFIAYSEIHLSLLRNVIRNSKYPHERAVASTVIAYYHDKAAIVNDLLEGAKDEDENVRNDAIRAIGILVEYSQKRPNLNITISPDPFIVLMHSISWSDRNKSSFVLKSLSEQRDPNLLSRLKREALEPIVDMAMWKSEGHAWPGYWILGRIAGWPDQEISENLKKNRADVVEKMLSTIK